MWEGVLDSHIGNTVSWIWKVGTIFQKISPAAGYFYLFYIFDDSIFIKNIVVNNFSNVKNSIPLDDET